MGLEEHAGTGTSFLDQQSIHLSNLAIKEFIHHHRTDEDRTAPDVLLIRAKARCNRLLSRRQAVPHTCGRHGSAGPRSETAS